MSVFSASRWPLKKLNAICGAKEVADPTRSPNAEFSYVDIASVSNESFSVTLPKRLVGRDAPSRARKRIRRGDVIVATTRPYLKSIAQIPEEFDGEVCSTGFCVLRPTEQVTSDWLFFCSLSEEFIGQLTACMRGANYPAVTDRDVMDAEIPLPSVVDQDRIVARIKECMDRVNEIASLCSESLRERAYLIESLTEAELKSAMRWRMKDVIDYPVEQSVYDLLQIPSAEGAAARARWIYVVAARNELVRTYTERFDEAKVPLTVIDIPETAQRNVATLYERDGRGVGLLYFDAGGGLLTVTSGGELYLARRFDFTISQIRRDDDDYREELYNRILVELQRTLDNFERQYSQIVLSRLMLGPQPEPTPLGAYLQRSLGIKVAEVALEDVLEFRGGVPEAQIKWRYFHLIGCSIRSEGPPQ